MLGALTWRLSCDHQVATERHRNRVFPAFRLAARAAAGAAEARLWPPWRAPAPPPFSAPPSVPQRVGERVLGGGLTCAWRDLVCWVLQLCASGPRTSPECQVSRPCLQQEC